MRVECHPRAWKSNKDLMRRILNQALESIVVMIIVY